MPDANRGMKVYSTWEILENTNMTEWNDLHPKKKEKFALIVSLGTIYFTDGGKVRDILLDIFPAGTITGDAFRDM